ncbi:lipopolysaccharide transport system ATP-binding protein [Methylomarinovum tepidoasis]|uniref:Lipopolysaccharide transport system ATP-binding protein n=1 Tax=Methylomarinovum tepidoasis TaxID=2840183 RepID=A0AAU9C4C3_9GAMM|nr:ABC transporter ATP-binding protein [Methylomarinovum sp. IN45]BCX87979.1 lipopolysaccharide transport system ATP-binding protein [Methylomarinovum sp. IN45]
MIVAEHLGKVYRRYARPLDSLLEMLFRRPRHTPFVALQDINFELHRGETMGVVGDNGAGKSTLLKILAGTISPSSGRLTVQGRVSAILELGTGFHPDFSGLENIRLGLALQGLDEAEAEALIPEIIEFSELAAFIDQPLKTYSSGMYVRLAFSVLTCTDPDILIVDEALAVGDVHFQKKCMDRMTDFRRRGKALLFCSHVLYQVRHLCDRAIWLDHGRIRLAGPADEVVDAYQDYVRSREGATPNPACEVDVAEETAAGKRAWLETVRLIGKELRGEPPRFKTGEPFSVEIVAYRGDLPLEDVHVGVVLKRNDGIQCFGASTEADDRILIDMGNGRVGIIYEIPSLPLLSGEYSLDVWLIDATGVHVYDSRLSCLPFQVRQPMKAVGVCWMAHEWRSPE